MKGWGFETAVGVWRNYSRRHDTRNSGNNPHKLTTIGSIKNDRPPKT